MKIKHVIYISLLVVLCTNIIAVNQTNIKASEISDTSKKISSNYNDNSSDILNKNSSNSSASSEISSSTNRANTSDSDSSSKKNDSRSIIVTKSHDDNKDVAQNSTSNGGEAPRSIVSAPEGTPVDANTPSEDGWSFLLSVFRSGFSKQPQPEQYFSVTDMSNARFTGMSILTSLGSGLGKTINVRRWHWDVEQEKWIEDSNQPTGKTGTSLIMGSLGFLDINDYQLNGLPSGTYYYQFSFNDGLWPFNKNYYSNLAKVVVTPQPKPATEIDTDTDNADGTPKVIYSDVNYNASAITKPVDSTDSVTWIAKTTKDLLTFSPSSGRTTKIMAGNGKADGENYVADSYYVNQVNTNPTVDGIPAEFNVSAGNVLKTKSVYVGGLPAYNKSADAGGSWYIGGLSDLVTASGATGPWHYSWKFTDANGKDVNTPTAADGVTNVEGDIMNLTNLNKEQPLTFTKDSSFIKKAANATAENSSYRAQLILTTNIDSGNGSKKAIVVSNKAELQVTKSSGELTLNNVPNFNFGNILAKDIYEGNSGQEASAKDTLKITDTRSKAGWQLTAKMNNMTSETGNKIINTSIDINGLPGNNTQTLSDKNTDISIASSDTSGSWPITGRLRLSANPYIKLKEKESFSSNIIWTLTSTTPETSGF